MTYITRLVHIIIIPIIDFNEFQSNSNPRNRVWNSEPPRELQKNSSRLHFVAKWSLNNLVKFWHKNTELGEQEWLLYRSYKSMSFLRTPAADTHVVQVSIGWPPCRELINFDFVYSRLMWLVQLWPVVIQTWYYSLIL